MSQPLHIGIVGCSAEGAALCYRTICAEGAALLGSHAHPEVSLHTASLSDYVKCLDSNDLRGVAKLMLESARKLAAGGADFLICPDNTIHQAFSLVAAASPLPLLHIAEVVASEAAARGYRRLGIIGTRWLVASDVYPEKLSARGLETVRPSDAERDEMGRLIMDELVLGIFQPATVAYFQGVIRGLQSRNCDAVVLGCTEIPLIIDDRNSSLPTLDSTRLLARAALRHAVEATRTNRRRHHFTPAAQKLWDRVPSAAQERILECVFCGQCRTSRRITDYTGVADGRGDIHLHGFCTECGHVIVRVVETSQTRA